ncbi:MAG: helix-hairpin-helix domain-containing protein [Bacteroidales bacterium]|nr:helix-hairpin-helix domain-containing protein [Bacteroidales bacterium]
MILKRLFILSSTLLVFTLQIKAQIADRDVINNLIEEIAEASDEELDYTLLYEDLYYFARNPLNLNTATREDLERFQFLSDFQIEDILEYQRTSGEMHSIYEIQLLESFSAKEIGQLLPFITVAKKGVKQMPDFKRALKYGRNSIFLRTQFNIQKGKGFVYDDNAFELNPDTNLYMGNRLKFYTKYQFDYKRKIRFGFVTEKDPGEQFFKETQKQGFDYYSVHLQVDDVWKFKTITLGDFQARFGQGLVSWSGMSTGKSVYVMSIKKKYDGLRKYSSTDENKFFRGAGATLRLKNFDITGFFSLKNIDGNRTLTDTVTNQIDFEGTFQTTGLHRTPNEVFDKHSVSELVYGGNIKWNKPWFKLGATYIQYSFSEELQKDQIYNQFAFQGNKGMNASIDYQANYKNFIFFGEEAISHSGGYALLNSVMIKLAPQMSLAVLQRYIAKDYQAYYAAGFGEQSNTINENGMYFGTEISPVRKVKVSAYYDLYKIPWLRYRAYAPSAGDEFFSQIDYSLSRYVNMHVRYKQESVLKNSSDDFTGAVPLVQTLKKEFRYHITYSLSRNLVLKNRIAFAKFDKEGEDIETGFMFYQDVNYKFETFPLKLNFRLAFFDAAYNARIYTYENDILYGYSIPGLSGQGIRTYLTLKYTVIKDFIDIWLRYANYSYSDRDIIGSSLDEIQGINKSEVKFQIRIKF